MTIDQLPTLADPTGTVYFPVSKGGADYKMETGGVVHMALTIQANSDEDFNVAGNSRFVVITSGAAAATKGMSIFNANNTGTLSKTDVLAASNVTYTMTSGNLNIATSAVMSALIIVFNGSVSLAV